MPTLAGASLVSLLLSGCAGGGGGGLGGLFGGGGLGGIVGDGYVAGATVFRDENLSGAPDPGEANVLTDAAGRFSGLGGTETRPVGATGGIDISTGLRFDRILIAPAGSTVINPITTVLQAFLDAQGGTLANAQATLIANLGLPAGLDLRSYDPIAAALANNADGLRAQAIAAQIANALFTGAAAAGGAIDAQAALIATNLANLLAIRPVDLSLPADLAAILPATVPAGVITSIAAANTFAVPPTLADLAAAQVELQLANGLVLTGGSGTGGAFIAGDTVTVDFNPGAGATLTSMTVDFTDFGGGAAVAATRQANGHFLGTYVITAGTIDLANAKVRATILTSANITATAEALQAAVLDNQAPAGLASPEIALGGATGTGGAWKAGDTLTVTVRAADIDSFDGSTLRADLSAFGGGSAAVMVETAPGSGTYRASLVLGAGLDLAAARAAVTVTDNAGNVLGPVQSAAARIDTTVPLAPQVTSLPEDAGGGINAAEAADGTTVVVSLAGTGAVAGDVLQVRWGAQAASATLLAGDITAGSATVTVGAAAMAAQGGGTISVDARLVDQAGNASARSTAVNATVDLDAPAISAVSLPANRTYAAGEALAFTVTFGEGVTAGGAAGATPFLLLKVGDRYRVADLQSSTATALSFRALVASSDLDMVDGISFAQAAIGLARQRLTLGGTYVPGDRITLSLSGTDVLTLTVNGGDIGPDDAQSLARIAARLADLVNADPTFSAAHVVAARSGNGTVTFVDTDGTVPAVGFAAQGAGGSGFLGSGTLDTLSATLADAAGNAAALGFTPGDLSLVLVNGGTGGVGVDGYLDGVTVFADNDFDGTLSALDPVTQAGPTGQFTLYGGTGPLHLFGGVDISTGLAFSSEYTAPAGYAVINPVSTLVQRLAGTSPALVGGAEDAVAAGLFDGGNRSTLAFRDFDPLQNVFDPSAAAQALQYQKSATVLALLADLGALALNAVNGSAASPWDLREGSLALFDAVAARVGGYGGGTLRWLGTVPSAATTDLAAEVQGLLADATSRLGTGAVALTSAQAAVTAELIARGIQLINGVAPDANLDGSVDSAEALGALRQVTQVQRVWQGQASLELEAYLTGASSTPPDTGALAAAVPAATVGLIVPAKVSLALLGPAQAFEDEATFTFELTRSGDTTGTTVVQYAVSGGPGLEAADFHGGVMPSGTVQFAPGETTQRVVLRAAADAQVEGDEGFRVTLADALGVLQFGADTAIATIRDDDPALPSLAAPATLDVAAGVAAFTGAGSFAYFDPAALFTLSVAATGGSAAVGGESGSSISLAGLNLTQVSGALAGAQFTGSTAALTGSLVYTITDEARGNAGSFAQAITIHQAPTLAGTGARSAIAGVDSALGGLAVADADSLELSVELRSADGVLAATAIGGAGVVTFSGGLLVTGSAADVNATLASVLFRGGTGGTTGMVSVVVSDGDALTADTAGSLSVAIAAGIPSLSRPDAALPVVKGQPTPIAGLSVADSDSAFLRVTLSAAEGTLAVPAGTGAAVTGGGTSTLVLSGSVSSLNAALRGLTFTAGTSASAPGLVVSVADLLADGSPDTASGGDPAGVEVPLLLTANPLPQAGGDLVARRSEGGNLVEDTPATLLLLGITLADPGSPVAPSAIRILSVAGGTVQAVDGAAITLGAQGSLLDATGGTAQVRFVPDADRDQAATLTYAVVDAVTGFHSAPSTVTVPIDPVNDAPALAPAGGARTFTEGGAGVLLAPTVTIADVDSVLLQSARVTLRSPAAGDALSWTPSQGITAALSTAGNGDLVLDFSGTATRETYEALLRTVAFSNDSDAPSTATRIAEVRVTDAGGAVSTPITRDIGVVGVNDAPTATAQEGVTFVEDAGPVAALSGLALADAEDDTLSGAVLRIAEGYRMGEDVLDVAPGRLPAGIGATWDPVSGTLRLSGAAPLADYAEALAAVTYANGLDNPTAGTRTLLLQVTDSAGASSAPSASSVTVQAVNDAPVFTPPAPIALADTAAADSFVVRVGALAAADPEGSPVTYGVAGGAVASGVATLAGSFGTLALNTATGGYTYTPNAGAINALAGNASESFAVTASDGAATSSRTLVVNVTGVNDAPVVATPGSLGFTDTAAEDSFSARAGMLSATDAEGATLTSGIVGGSVAGGTSTRVGTYGTLAVETATGAYTYTPNAAAINALSGNASETFTVTSSDGSATGSSTLTVSLAGTNDTPVVTTPSAIRLTDTAAVDTFSPSTGTFVASDAEGAALTYGIAGGSVSGGTATLAGSYGTLAVDTATGAYEFTPNASAINALSANASQTFTITATDGGATGSSPLTVNLTATNDTPVVTSPSAISLTDTAAADTFNSSTGTFAASGAEGTALTYGIAGGNVSGGTATLAGSYGTLVVDTATGAYEFTPNVSAINALSANISQTFTITATDGSATGSSTLTVNLTATNDAPVVAAPTAIALTDTAATDTFSPSTGTFVASDAEGAALTYGIVGGSESGGTASLAGSYGTLAVDTTTGAYSFTPNASAINALSASTSQTFTITATDGGVTGSSTLTVNLTAANDTPVVTQPSAISLTDTAAADTFSSSTGTFAASDAEGTALTYGIAGGNVSGGTATLAGSYGTLVVDTTSGAYEFTPNASAMNALSASTSQTFTIIATDGSATGSSTLTVNLAAANDTPVVAAPTAIALTDTAVTDTFSPSTGTFVASDAEGTALTYGSAGGSVSAGTATLAGSYGTLAVDTTTGAYSFTPNASAINALSANASQTFTITATDGSATGSGTLTVNLTANNDAPVVAAPTAIALTDTVATDSFSPSTGTFVASDAEGAALTYGIAGGSLAGGTATLAGSYGTLAVDTGTGAYTFTPNASAINALSANTSQAFTITATDGSATGSSTLSVNLTAANDTPIVTAPASIGLTDTAAADTFSPSTGTFVASDAEGAALTYGISGANLSGGTATLAGSYGTLVVDTSTGAYTFTPNASAINALSANASQTFTITATDGGASGSGTLTVNLTAANDTPVVTSPSAISLTDTAGTDTFSPSTGTFVASDAEGAALTYGIAGGSVSGGTASLAGSYGTLAVDTTTGAYEFTPNASAINALSANASQTFTITATDGGATGSSTLTVNLTAANDTPVVASPSAISLTDTAGTDTFSPSTGTFVASDAEGIALTYGIAGGSVSGGTATLAGSYGTLVVDTSTGAYTFTPNASAINALSANASQTFTITATDGGASGSGTLTVNLTAANDTPVVTSPLAIGLTDTAAADTFSPSTGTFVASDAEGGALTYGIAGGSVSGGTASLAGSYGTLAVDTTTGVYEFTPNASAINALSANASQTFTITATDGGATGSSTLTVNIASADDLATISGQATGSLTETNAVQTVTGKLDATDPDSAAAFSPATGVAGTYGRFSIDASGQWSYTLTSAHDDLAGGVTYTDSFSVETTDGASSAVVISILGDNDALRFVVPVGVLLQGGGAQPVPGLSVFDPDEAHDGSPIVVMITAHHGVLAVSGALADADPDPRVLRVSGLPDAVAAVLATLTYAPDVRLGEDALLLDATDGAASYSALLRVEILNPGSGTFLAESGLMRSGEWWLGTTGNDVFVATADDDLFAAGTGDDRLDGLSAGDFFLGGSGTDTVLVLRSAIWTFDAEGAPDILRLAFLPPENADPLTGGRAEAGVPLLALGADGQSFVQAEVLHLAGADGLVERSFAVSGDTLQLSSLADRVVLGDAADRVSGGAGDDLLVGLSGADVLHGDAGHDLLVAGNPGTPSTADVAYLHGDDGDDVLVALAGQVSATGGAGADVFAVRAGADVSLIIEDFTPGTDRIDLNGVFDAAQVDALFANGTLSATVQGHSVSVTVAGGVSLSAADFDVTGVDWVTRLDPLLPYFGG